MRSHVTRSLHACSWTKSYGRRTHRFGNTSALLNFNSFFYFFFSNGHRFWLISLRFVGSPPFEENHALEDLRKPFARTVYGPEQGGARRKTVSESVSTRARGMISRYSRTACDVHRVYLFTQITRDSRKVGLKCSNDIYAVLGIISISVFFLGGYYLLYRIVSLGLHTRYSVALHTHTHKPDWISVRGLSLYYPRCVRMCIEYGQSTQ